jgi:exopolysaccharide production protein ExoQ
MPSKSQPSPDSHRGTMGNEVYAVRPFIWLIAAVLSLALVCLNHDFDVVAGRIENTVESGGGLDIQAESEGSVANIGAQRKMGFAALLAAAGLALLAPKSCIDLQLNTGTILVAAIFCWTAASWLWSTERYETSRELVRLGMFALTAALLVWRFRLREIVFLLLAVCVVALAVDCAADIVAGTFRPWLAEFRLGGALHPNHVGRLGAVIAMIGYAASWEPRYRRWAWALIGAGVMAVLLSRSRSGLATFVAGIVALQFMGLAGRRFVVYATSVATAAALLLLIYGLLPRSLRHDVTDMFLMGRVEDASSLTGRVPLWQEMWKDGRGYLWKGHGYGAYWTAERNYELGDVIQWYPRHSHSVYMEVFIDLGLVGVLLAVALALYCTVRYSQLTASTGRFEYRFLGALFVAGMANGFFEVGFVQPRFEGLFMGMAAILLMRRQRELAMDVRKGSKAPLFAMRRRVRRLSHG